MSIKLKKALFIIRSYLWRNRKWHTGYKDNTALVVVSGQSIMISLREKVKIKKVPNKWGSFDNTYEPEGSLVFKLEKYSTKEWQDGKKNGGASFGLGNGIGGQYITYLSERQPPLL
ncbi:MAG: hypothetical protein QM731_08405 [Chitinophagaceae bacterium]